MIPRARHLVAAALSSALLILPAWTGVANATTTATTTAGSAATTTTGSATAAASKVYAVPLAKTAADVKKVADYWKPDRLKQAAPATPGAQASSTPSSAGGAAGPGAPVTSAASAASAASVAAAAKRTAAQIAAPALPRKGRIAKTIGKVFFRFGDKEYWCSASAVTARNRSVVATAGHCAYDPRQAKAAEYWIFVPNPGENGETPDGIYVGAAISMHEDWSGKGDYDYDYAFVTVHRGFVWTPKDGSYVMQDVGRLQDNVGGQGLELNRKPGTYTVSAWGYPAGAQPDGSHPFDGKKLWLCEEGATRWTVAPSLDLQKGVQLMACDFSPGASGGPWLIGYDQTRKLGSLNGVNSLTWNRDAKGWYDAVSSPYFDTTTGDVYKRAAAQTTPANVT
ncbi:trypsin-like serine peptidase [Nonomuraea zeae]|uniref:Trypsin-like serine protease n=1 Tax=Nonomuraea zeae TaxID=1642303 RepID=A0A5S4GEZ0_9ACTN|nr:trypsin-like serine protease [Nonomuraea zeae]TMR31545.1 trypsin-like serine protease [Nonomuraea zeae]